MESASRNRTVGMTVIAVLALVQSVAGVLRALRWFDVGSDLLGQGLLLLPAIGLFAMFRGALVAAIALLYVLFACGVFMGRSWARSLGIVVAAVTLLLVASVVIQGEMLSRALLWAIVPVAMLYYLLTSAGRQALTRGN
jgi:hypothetical protein